MTLKERAGKALGIAPERVHVYRRRFPDGGSWVVVGHANPSMHIVTLRRDRPQGAGKTLAEAVADLESSCADARVGERIAKQIQQEGA